MSELPFVMSNDKQALDKLFLDNNVKFFITFYIYLTTM